MKSPKETKSHKTANTKHGEHKPRHETRRAHAAALFSPTGRAPGHPSEDVVAEPTAELDAALGLDDGVDVEGDPEHDTVPLSPAEQITSTQALERARPRAMALRPAEVIRYRVAPAIAIVNVGLIHTALAAYRPDMPRMMPYMNMDHYDALPDTALACVAAANIASKATTNGVGDGEFGAKLAQARQLRGRLLPFLQGLAMSNHVPMKVYTDILAGRGARDTAQDCVDLAVAFRQYASAIDGKHPISAADLDAAEAVGTWLLRNLKFRGAHTLKAAVGPEVDLRNRIATILTRDYEDASIIAHYFLRENYLKVAPPLRSKLVVRRPAASTPTTPEPPQPTAPVGGPAGAPPDGAMRVG